MRRALRAWLCLEGQGCWVSATAIAESATPPPGLAPTFSLPIARLPNSFVQSNFPEDCQSYLKIAQGWLGTAAELHTHWKMRERMDGLGGTLEINSHPGQGTRLRIILAEGEASA